MNKRTLIVIFLIILLSVTLYITFKISRPSIAEQKENLTNSQISIFDGAKEVLINLEDIESMGGEAFEAVLDTSSSDASLHNYKGLQLKDIFKVYDIGIKDKKLIVLTGVDGFSVAYSVEEVLEKENVYIAYMEDGEYISYQSIVKSDMFSNRRCKWLTKIEVK